MRCAAHLGNALDRGLVRWPDPAFGEAGLSGKVSAQMTRLPRIVRKQFVTPRPDHPTSPRSALAPGSHPPRTAAAPDGCRC